MKKSSKALKMVMSGGMFMNSSSSNESQSDDDKCHFPTVDLIFSDNEQQDDEPIVVTRRHITRLKRQQATTSLQSPLSIRNASSLESIDNDDVIMSDQTMIEKHGQLSTNMHDDLNRASFNDSERTDSGIGRDSSSSCRLNSYADSIHHQSQQQHEHVDKRQGICMRCAHSFDN
jgi:hypothetical protein